MNTQMSPAAGYPYKEQMPNQRPNQDNRTGEEVSLFTIASVIVMWRRLIMILGFGFGIVGLLIGFSGDKLYKSTIVFMPQAPQAAQSGIAAAASQFGISLPSAGGGWGPPMYIALLRSRALLEPIARDSVTVVEENNRRTSYMELLKATTLPTAEQNMVKAVSGLSDQIGAEEDKRLGAVRVSVTTKWPSVSVDLARKVVQRVNDFNLEVRRNQATSERKFAEAQADQAEKELRAAERALEEFTESNRVIGPSQRFRQGALEREVQLQQVKLTTLVSNREEARLREVRDTPVIMVLEEPQLPFIVEPRKSARKAIVGGVIGGLLALLIAFTSEGLARVRSYDHPEAQRFFALVRDATPRFLRRRA